MIDGKNRMVRDTIAVFTPGDKEPARLYQADKGSLHSPVCLAPRPRPPLLADTVQRTDDGEEAKTGRVFCQNVFITQKTQADWQRVRAARLLGGLPPTLRSQRSSVVHIGIEVVELGTVPLAPDGSFYVEVPANMPLAVQLVDGEGRPEINQTSWFYVRPGETRSCIGCHHRPQSVSRSSSAFPQALRTPPLKLLGQGDAHRFRGNNPAVNGMTDVQFDRFREVGSLDLHSRSSGAENGVGGWAREIARLVQQLQGPREDLRISATQRLAIFRDRSVAPELAKCLRGRSRELRVAAALALGTCGTRESVEPLLEVLDDGDPLVVQAATVSLENLTGHKEPDRAFDTAAGRKETAAAWRAWRKANSWDAIEKSLVGDLSSTDRVTKRRAVVALGHIGSAAARAALRQLVAEQIAQPSPYPKGLVLDAISFDAASPLNPRTLQEALRSLGYLRDREAVAILGEVIAWGAPTLDTSKGMSGMFAPPARETVLHLHAVEAALQALGRIATPEAEAVVIDNLCRFAEHVYYLGWYGDDGALFACHAAPIFHRALEAMDAMGSKRCGEVVSRAVRSLPTDVDRMLFMEPDSYETLVGRLVESSGQADAIIETCLAVLGDPDAKIVEQWTRDVTDNHGAMAGKLGRESRAAHVLSVVCVDRRYEPRVRAVFDRYRKGETIVKGNQPRSPKAGLPNASATRSWVCFFMARTLARLGDPASFPALLDALNGDPPEAAWGRPKPWLHGVQWLHNEYTPCYRAAAAFALGRLGDKRAVPVLLNVASDLDMNSLDTRYAAIKALERIADPQSLSPLRELAKDYPEVSTRRAMRRACAVLSGESPLTPLD
jgi:HEAT repeat protein